MHKLELEKQFIEAYKNLNNAFKIEELEKLLEDVHNSLFISKLTRLELPVTVGSLEGILISDNGYEYCLFKPNDFASPNLVFKTRHDEINNQTIAEYEITVPDQVKISLKERYQYDDNYNCVSSTVGVVISNQQKYTKFEINEEDDFTKFSVSKSDASLSLEEASNKMNGTANYIKKLIKDEDVKTRK